MGDTEVNDSFGAELQGDLVGGEYLADKGRPCDVKKSRDSL